MTKRQLLNELFEYFKDDEELIKENLLLAMDKTCITATNDGLVATITVEIKRKENEKNENN